LKRYVPVQYQRYIDETMLCDGKTCQLEFSTHFKYYTTFNLIFEFVPDPGFVQKDVQQKLNFEEV
jgi:hypothetical protein